MTSAEATAILAALGVKLEATESTVTPWQTLARIDTVRYGEPYARTQWRHWQAAVDFYTAGATNDAIGTEPANKMQ